MIATASRRVQRREKKVARANFSSGKHKTRAKRNLFEYYLDAKISARSGILRGENFSRAKNKKWRRDARDCAGARVCALEKGPAGRRRRERAR
jgi:hypothetical protein